MINYELRRRQKEEVARRAETPDHMYRICRALGCGKPATAGTDQGLNQRWCRSHADHYQRHGDPFSGSYPAKVLNPCRRAAYEWLTAHPEEFWVKRALEGIRGQYRGAGPHVEAFRLMGLKPRERARAAWARLRQAKIDPRLPVAAWLGVEIAIEEDMQSCTKREYKRVQAAKVVHRMASGSHKRWVQEVPDPRCPQFQTTERVTELHVYPKSRGRVLRYIGESLEECCELLSVYHVEEIMAFKQELAAVGKLGSRAHPFGAGTRTR